MHSTPHELEDQKIRVLTELLVDKVRDHLNNSSSSKNPLG